MYVSTNNIPKNILENINIIILTKIIQLYKIIQYNTITNNIIEISLQYIIYVKKCEIPRSIPERLSNLSRYRFSWRSTREFLNS